MAEILLKGVLVKLAGFTVEKVLELCGINKVIENFESLSTIANEVDNLKKELCYIQKFIEDADKRSIVDQTQKKWVTDLIEIAYQIEDSLDIFLLECPMALRGIKSLPKKISNLPFLFKFQTEMEDILKEISGIHERGKKYDSNNLGAVTLSVSELELDHMEDPEVVGLDKDIENVISNLCDKNIERLAVVSIVGHGGLGKTTLARKVFYSEKVRTKFSELSWVTISQKYDLVDVLGRIAENFNVDSNATDPNKVARKIREHLVGKHYLIVLDDVWTKELYDQLKKVLPHTNNGSRVLITTRDKSVARYADTTYEPHEPGCLNDAESLELFLINAIPKSHSRSVGSILHLKNLPNEFIKKCKGLPLALVVLGGLLSTMPCNYHDWKQLLNTMKWMDDGINCTKIIATSFEHLPFAMKLCFMYFAAFPEDQEIEAQPLLRMWIAEGLVPQEGRTMEETAKRVLDDLVQRSMVQISERYADGSIKSLFVHDILRELAVHQAKENKFLVVCSKHDDWMSPHCMEARRIAVHYSNFNESMKQYANPKLRSLLTFGESDLDCSKYRLLRVLANINKKGDLQRLNITQMPHLRYLQLTRTEMIDPKRILLLPKDGRSSYAYNETYFKEWIKAMKSLETLDLRSQIHRDLSPWIWEIKTLRHVLLSLFSFEYTTGPSVSHNLKNLQTLRGVIPSKSWETSGLPNILEVRELGIQLDSPYSAGMTAALLGKLRHIVHLSMSGNNIQIKQFERVFPFLEDLKQLLIVNTSERSDACNDLENGEGSIVSCWPRRKKFGGGHSFKGSRLESGDIHLFRGNPSELILELKDNTFPPNVVELLLKDFEFKSDPMPVLEKLGSLKSLTISSPEHSVCTHQHSLCTLMSCSAGGFKQIEELTINMPTLEELKIEFGAMPLVKRLKVVGHPFMVNVPQLKWFIDHKNLRVLHWNNCEAKTLNKISEARPDIRIDTTTKNSFAPRLSEVLSSPDLPSDMEWEEDSLSEIRKFNPFKSKC